MKRRGKILFDNHPKLPFEEFESPRSTTHGHPPIPTEEELMLTDEDHKFEKRRDSDLLYFSMGSGSSGNASFIGTHKNGIIVDAGVKPQDMEQMLADNGISMRQVRGLLLTHDHSDHVRYAYSLLRGNKHIQLYCTNRVLNGLLRRHNISRRIKEYHNPIFKEIPFKVSDLEITAFEVPHDGSDNMGFSILYQNHNFVLATDLGAITSRARHYMTQANYLVIESNYDLQMLLTGRYPEYLKARIQTERGHLDNVMTAEFLKEIVTPRLKYVFLCHLSQDNNTPAIALRTSREALESAGLKVGDASESLTSRVADIQLMCLPRFEASRLFIFPNPDL